MPQPSHTSETQVVGEIDRRELEEAEAAKHAEAKRKNHARPKAEPEKPDDEKKEATP